MLKWMMKHRIIVSLASVVLVLCIIISVSYFRGTGVPGDKAAGISNSVFGPVTEAAYSVRDWFDSLINFRKTLHENERLKEEIDSLSRELTNERLTRKDLDELRSLSAALNYSNDHEEYFHVSAKVTAVDNSDPFSMFMIDAGTETGIKPESVVISGNGLVGRIAETGEGFSKVVSITDENVNVSFEVLRDMSILGIVNGSTGGNIEGFTLKDDAGIVEGDMLITTGIGIYPEGIEIGRVTEVSFNKEMQLLTVKAKPVTDFRNIRKVMVLVK